MDLSFGMDVPLTWTQSLAYVCALTAIMWFPYILDQMYSNGTMQCLFMDGLILKLRYDDEKLMRIPMHAWAVRSVSAHKNAVENLALFAPLLFACSYEGLDADVPAFIYLCARLVHWPAQIIGPSLPGVRTSAFAVGWAVCLVMAYALATK
jgi:uncharacterized MAPEG superfamily protein